MARRRSGLEGVTKLRMKLRRIDPEITKDLRTVVAEGAQAIQFDATAAAPVDEGDLALSIEYQISRDGMTAVVGPGVKAAEIMRRKAGSPFAVTTSKKVNLRAVNKRLLFQFFKGYWHEFGTKGSPENNVPPLPARPFMGPAYLVNRDWIKNRASRAIAKVLERVSRGT